MKYEFTGKKLLYNSSPNIVHDILKIRGVDPIKYMNTDNSNLHDFNLLDGIEYGNHQPYRQLYSDQNQMLIDKDFDTE